jgi:hypothetical protein
VLSDPGPLSFPIIIGSWVVIAAAFVFIAFWAGRLTREENDGCLLGIANVLMTGFGGAVGWFLLKNDYPFFIVSSILGALIFPSINTAFFLRAKRR